MRYRWHSWLNQITSYWQCKWNNTLMKPVMATLIWSNNDRDVQILGIEKHAHSLQCKIHLWFLALEKHLQIFMLFTDTASKLRTSPCCTWMPTGNYCLSCEPHNLSKDGNINRTIFFNLQLSQGKLPTGENSADVQPELFEEKNQSIQKFLWICTQLEIIIIYQ